ncbi:MAG: GNAT family N-acetyltransferase [Solirubrobacterales bacterium]
MRRLGRDDVGTLVEWAAAEGWDPGPGDAEAFWAADPDAFLGFDRDGALAGGGAVVAYGRALGFVGLFILRPEFRGAGLGRELWSEMLVDLRSRLAPGAPIGLDAVAALQPFYADSGFVASHDTSRIRFGDLGAAPQGLTPLADVPFADLLAYDARCFGAEREPFLRTWREVEGAVGLASLHGDGRIEGYGLIRPTRSGSKVGPLFAAEAAIAERILRGLLARRPEGQAVLDVPSANPEAVELAARLGGGEVFGTARMWLGDPPPIPWGEVFGMTTLELG